MRKLPYFFAYKDGDNCEPDSGYENLQDFFLRWTIRCAEEKYSSVNQLLNSYSKRILFKLIFDNPELNYKVEKVKSWRQWNQIDLLFEIYILGDHGLKKYVLNIENKWYTSVGENQLKKYSDCVTDYYGGKGFEIKNYVIFCDSEKLFQIPPETEANGYKFITIEDLSAVIDVKHTGNDLFDEYWFNS